MILGIPKEILENETRVAAIPATIKQYVAAGFNVKVQSGAGAASCSNESAAAAAGSSFSSSM